MCIRCREVKDKEWNDNNIMSIIREYNCNEDKEFFISFESNDNNIIYGFLRLRINKNNNYVVFNELRNCALIRELHV